MKRGYLFLICFLVVCETELFAQTTAPPSIVVRGFAAYRAFGVDSAFRVWLANSPVGNDSIIRGSALVLQQLENAYGRMEWNEILSVTQIGSPALKVYAIVHNQKGPLYMWFECYRTSADWTVVAFLFKSARSDYLSAPDPALDSVHSASSSCHLPRH